MRSISVKELSHHNKDGNLWLAINGEVYDFSSFVLRHPGGSDGTS